MVVSALVVVGMLAIFVLLEAFDGAGHAAPTRKPPTPPPPPLPPGRGDA